MENLNGKRLLLLGGSTWKDAIADFAREQGITLIAAGNNPNAKYFEIAHEKYVVDSTDAAAMKKLIVDKKIDGVHMGSHETVVTAACEYLADLNLPCYCTKNQWQTFQNKESFKAACISVGLPVVPQIKIDEKNLENCAKNLNYPVVTKPVDGCGSNGFSVCYNVKEFLQGYNLARENSLSGKVIVEKLANNNSVVVFYTLSNGEAFFSGIERKYTVHYKKSDSYVMGAGLFESSCKKEFQARFDKKLRQLFKNLKLNEGTIWLEVFQDGDNFYFNEAGYRYGGSVSVYPVNYFYGINQVAADIYYSLTGKSCIKEHTPLIPQNFKRKKFYAIYNIHLKAGTIAKISGVEEFSKRDNIVKIPIVKNIGDTIKNSGTFAQVFALVHFVFDTREELIETVNDLHKKIIVEDAAGNNLVNRMLDIETAILDFFGKAEVRHDMNIKILTQENLISAGCFNVGESIKVCEKAFVAYSQGKVIFPEKTSVIFDETEQNRINCLPAGFTDEKIYGMKWVSVFPNNPHKRNIPNLTAVILLSDLNTGFPLVFMEGSLCSNLRTASVGAVAAKYLARKNSEVIGFIGAGEQAKSHFLTMKKIFPGIKICKVASRTLETENKFVAQMSKFYPNVEIIPCHGVYKNAVVDADIIVTAISGQEKILQADWIKRGAFYCHVGGLEDDFAVPKMADKIICDNWEAVKHRTQTISRMYQAGLLSDNSIYADLHEIITGAKQGRQNDSEFIYFNSVGMSFVDIALANWMYQTASARHSYGGGASNMGDTINFKSCSMFDYPSSIK